METPSAPGNRPAVAERPRPPANTRPEGNTTQAVEPELQRPPVPSAAAAVVPPPSTAAAAQPVAPAVASSPRPAPAAAVPFSDDPSAICGRRVLLAQFVCMERECRSDALRDHPACKAWYRQNPNAQQP